MKTESESPHLAACVAPEDLNCGDYVAALNIIYEIPPYLCGNDGFSIGMNEPIKMQFRAPGAGTPLKIKAICLPFVFVKSPKGTSETMDVRQIQFVRLNPDYASVVWKELK